MGRTVAHVSLAASALHLMGLMLALAIVWGAWPSDLLGLGFGASLAALVLATFAARHLCGPGTATGVALRVWCVGPLACAVLLLAGARAIRLLFP